ncbi:hypothetical protein AgCh_038872 [Apium graveolens]
MSHVNKAIKEEHSEDAAFIRDYASAGLQFFIMDEKRSRDVLEAFIKLHEEGLIFNQCIILAHKVCSKGLEVDKAKVGVIENLLPPISLKGIRSFLGHAGIYRCFIKDFSKISKPLCNFVEKEVSFKFDDECLAAFETLMKSLITTPVITTPDWTKSFEMMCDASDYAVDAVLGQRKNNLFHVVYYASKMLNGAQMNYTTTEKELLDIEFELEIKDRKGTENQVADHLSRLENPDSTSHDKTLINESFPDEQLFAIEEQGADLIIRRCIPFCETEGILRDCHSTVYGGHYGGEKTAARNLQAGFFWPTLFKDAHQFILRCDHFQRVGNLTRKDEMPLNMMLEVEVFDVWGIDFMGPFISSCNNQYILLAVDYVSKWVEVKALPTNDIKVVLSFLHKQIFTRFGMPQVIISDENSKFTSMMQRYNVNQRIANAYHLQTNGQAEVSNREIERILEKVVCPSRKDWSLKFDEAVWAYRTTYKTPLGMSPFQLVYGKGCHLPAELEHKAYWTLTKLNLDQDAVEKKRMLQLNELDEFRLQAYENNKIYKEKVKRWHDRKLSPKLFVQGQQVLLFNSRLRLLPGKLKSRCSGPFIVKTVFPHGAVEIFENDLGQAFKVNGEILVADEEYARRLTKPILKNRGFLPSGKDGELLSMIAEKGWITFCESPEADPMSMVREFYANAKADKNGYSVVRGLTVDYQPEAIRRVIGHRQRKPQEEN